MRLLSFVAISQLCAGCSDTTRCAGVEQPQPHAPRVLAVASAEPFPVSLSSSFQRPLFGLENCPADLQHPLQVQVEEWRRNDERCPTAFSTFSFVELCAVAHAVKGAEKFSASAVLVVLPDSYRSARDADASLLERARGLAGATWPVTLVDAHGTVVQMLDDGTNSFRVEPQWSKGLLVLRTCSRVVF